MLLSSIRLSGSCGATLFGRELGSLGAIPRMPLLRICLLRLVFTFLARTHRMPCVFPVGADPSVPLLVCIFTGSCFDGAEVWPQNARDHGAQVRRRTANATVALALHYAVSHVCHCDRKVVRLQSHDMQKLPDTLLLSVRQADFVAESVSTFQHAGIRVLSSTV